MSEGMTQQFDQSLAKAKDFSRWPDPAATWPDSAAIWPDSVRHKPMKVETATTGADPYLKSSLSRIGLRP